MRQFKVKTTSVSGGGNKIYKSGQIVSEDGFIGRHVDELVDKGFLELVIEDAPKFKAEKVKEELPAEPVIEDAAPAKSKASKAIDASI